MNLLRRLHPDGRGRLSWSVTGSVVDFLLVSVTCLVLRESFMSVNLSCASLRVGTTSLLFFFSYFVRVTTFPTPLLLCRETTFV